MRTRYVCSILAAIFGVVLAASTNLNAQVGTEGGILGVVTDSSGAVVAGAEVTVVNVDTNLTKKATTDSQGNFEILALPRGTYSVTASFTGFKTWVVEKTELTLGERKRVSPVLTVGEISDRVTVEAQAELIQTEKGSLEATIAQKQIIELPLNGRNPVELVRLIPGMRYLGQGGPERGITVQGLGHRDDATEFQVDGLNANAGMDEKGFGIPNVDTIAEFNVETSNFSAEHGRNPLQVLSVTKSGTNAFHGTLWEFHRNHKLDAFNTFAKTPGARKPKLIRNQYGFTTGGPIAKDKTFFFTSYEGTRIREERLYNSTTVRPEFLRGDFSALGRQIRDPQTGQPFAGNLIPESRFSNAAKFFFPYILLPNTGAQQFVGLAPRPSDTDELTVRVDHQLTANQRIYGRYVINDFLATFPQYKPDVTQENGTKQQNLAVNYTYTVTPTTLFTLGANYLRSLNLFTTPVAGKDNLTQQAGIQGFPSAGREELVGLPSVFFTGYTEFAAPWGTPGRLWFESHGGKAAVNMVRGSHSLNVGYEYNNRTTYGRHGSFASRGSFNFNGQYTGDAIADYLLGLTSGAGRNYPLQTFGTHSSPYSALYAQDFWKISPDVTLNLGVRYDYWHEKAYVRGNAVSFDVKQGKAIAGENIKTGQVDLTSQPIARFLAEATKNLWISASQAGVPGGLFIANGYVSPRLGVAWRPAGGSGLVVRAGYGIFPNSFRNNATASSIVGPPYWAFESLSFSAASLQRWETAFSADPSQFGFQSVGAPVPDIVAMKSHEWNISVQKELPWKSAITVSYVANRAYDGITQNEHNAPPPGLHTNLQADRPLPGFSSINIYENIGKSWYRGLQVKMERRFSEGFSYLLSYSLSKHTDEASESLWDGPTPYAPAGYNRGRSGLDRTHILAINTIYELPFGKGRKHLNNVHPVANVILGGWQLSGIYNFVSGSPLSFIVPGATLGNGFSTRANLSGDLDVSSPSAAGWFNPQALSAPALYAFGNSGLNIFDGPGSHVLDTSLTKNFYFAESRYVQFRWEMFNMPNHVNLSNPQTTIGLATTGRIFSAGAARSMQLGLKLVF